MKVNAYFLPIIVVVIAAVFISEVDSQNAQKNRPRTTKRPANKKNARVVAAAPKGMPAAANKKPRVVVAKPVQARPVKPKNGKAKPAGKAVGTKKNGKKPGGNKKVNGLGSGIAYSAPLMYSAPSPPIDVEDNGTGAPGSAPVYNPVDANKLAVVTPDDYDTDTDDEDGWNHNGNSNSRKNSNRGGTTKMTKNKYRNRRKHKSEELEEEETVVYQRNHGGRKTSRGYGGAEEYEDGDYVAY